MNSNLNEKKNIPAIIKPLHDLKVLTFAQPLTGGYAEYGVFMSMASPRFDYVGNFYAAKIARVFNGANPRELKQILETPLTIAINLKTAKALEVVIPPDILAVADEIYGYSSWED